MAQRISGVIRELMSGAQAQQGPLFGIQRRWKDLVGEGLAAHSRPVRLAKGKLFVHVDHPGDGFEMSYRAPALLRRLKEQTQGSVEELVIRAAHAQPARAHGVSG